MSLHSNVRIASSTIFLFIKNLSLSSIFWKIMVTVISKCRYLVLIVFHNSLKYYGLHCSLLYYIYHKVDREYSFKVQICCSVEHVLYERFKKKIGWKWTREKKNSSKMPSSSWKLHQTLLLIVCSCDASFHWLIYQHIILSSSKYNLKKNL